MTIAIFLGLHGSSILAIILSALIGLVLYINIGLFLPKYASDTNSQPKTSFRIIILLILILIGGMVSVFI